MQSYNFDACMCFYDAHCRMMCPEGEDLIPTQMCECVPTSLIDDLYIIAGSGSVIGLTTLSVSSLGALALSQI